MDRCTSYHGVYVDARVLIHSRKRTEEATRKCCLFFCPGKSASVVEDQDIFTGDAERYPGIERRGRCALVIEGIE